MRLRALLFVLIALLCCGCYAHDTVITVNRDGSGVIEVTAGINKAYERAEVAASRLPSDSDLAQVILNGFISTSQDLSPDWKPIVATWDDGTFAGAKLTLSFTDQVMLQSQLSKLLAVTQDSGRDDLFTDMQARATDGQLEIVAALQGQTIASDNGQPLPSGPEGIGRTSWAVILPQIDTTTPPTYATRNGNAIRWVIPLGQLPEGTELQLSTVGRLSAATTPAVPTAIATALPTATLPPVAPQPVPTQVPPNTPPIDAPTAVLPTAAALPPPPPSTNSVATAQPTQPTQPAPIATVAPLAATAQPTAAQVSTALPLAEPSAAAVEAVPYPVPPTVLPASGELVAESPVASPAAAATDQAFLPIASVQAPAAAPASVEPAASPSPTRYLAVWLLLLCSALCFSYVIFRRAQRARAAQPPAAEE